MRVIGRAVNYLIMVYWLCVRYYVEVKFYFTKRLDKKGVASGSSSNRAVNAGQQKLWLCSACNVEYHLDSSLRTRSSFDRYLCIAFLQLLENVYIAQTKGRITNIERAGFDSTSTIIQIFPSYNARQSQKSVNLSPSLLPRCHTHPSLSHFLIVIFK